MKMFVWVNPYPVMYGGSKFVAVAETEAEAREIAAKAYTYGKFEKMTPHSHEVPNRPPDRVVECPCAEWDEWSE
jgi:hypothetical protein